MPKQLGKKIKFNGGEISPRMYGRQDLEIWKAGLKTASNVIVMPEGGIKKRPGTQYIDTAAGYCRLVPFQYSHNESVVIEFSSSKIRFYANRAQLLDSSDDPYEISSPYSEDDLFNIVYSQFGDTLYLTCTGYSPRKLIRTGNSNWTLSTVDTTSFAYYLEEPQTNTLGPGSLDLYTAGGYTSNAPVGAITAFKFTGHLPAFMNGDDIGRTLRVIADGKSGELTITDVDPPTLTANGNDQTIVAGRVTQVFTEDSYASEDVIISGTHNFSLTPSGTTGTITLTGNYLSWHRYAGKIISINGGYAQVSTTYDEFDNALSATVLSTLSSTSAATAGNWGVVTKLSEPELAPQVVGFFDQRLVYANSPVYPQTAFISAYQDFDDFLIGSAAADPMNVTVAYGNYSAISWLFPSVDLIVGTATGEGSIRGRESVLTPASAETVSRTGVGSGIQVPVKVDNEALFISSTDRVYSIRFNFEIDNYTTQDLTRFAEHLTTDGLKELAFAQKPDRLICAVTDTGDMLLGTFNREESVMGWSKMTIPNANIESVTTIRQGSTDEIWMSVQRTIDGNTVRYIEVMDPSDTTNQIYGTDSFLTYSGVSASIISGLDHLEGETVSILANGAPHNSKVVTGGQVTLDRSVTSATIGLPYTMTIETLDHDIDFGTGSTQGQPGVSWIQPILRVHESTSPTVNGQTTSTRYLDSTNMDNSVDLYSGDLKYSSVDSAALTITDSQPLPVFITAIFGTVSYEF